MDMMINKDDIIVFTEQVVDGQLVRHQGVRTFIENINGSRDEPLSTLLLRHGRLMAVRPRI